MEKPELFYTTEQEGHIHIVYKNADGLYEMYEGKKHMHFVRRTEALPIQVDDQGNVSREPVPEQVIVEAYEGHTHDLIKIEADPKDVKVSEKDLVKEFYALYGRAYDISDDFRRRADIAYNFYIGGEKQWCLDVAAKALLEANNRAVISTNEVKPIVKVLSGQQRQQRTGMKAYPTDSGSPIEADIATAVLRHISQANSLNKKESEVFKGTLITGRGDIGIEIDTVNTVTPEIKITKDNYQDVFYGPHEDEGLADCEYVFKRKWVPYSTLLRQFPDKKDELELAHKYFSAPDNDVVDLRADEVNGEETVPFNSVSGQALYDKDARKYQVLLLERKVYKTVPVAVVEEKDIDNLWQSLDGVEPKIISAIKKSSKKGGIGVINHTKYEIEVVMVAGDTVLKHFVRNITDFSTLPLYAEKEHGYVQGIVEPIIPHQREVNKRHSQAIDALIFNNANAWAFDDDTFPTKAEEEKFRNRANDPSLVVKLRNTEKPPIKIQTTKNFQEPVAMLELSSSKMKAVSGVNMELLGNESNVRSGIAIARRLRQGLVINDDLFDNLSFWKEKLGRVILKYVQEYYSTEDIMKILGRVDGQEDLKLGGQRYAEISREHIRKIIDNMDFTKYDIVISESASSPTKAMDLLSALTELTQAGQLPQSPMITIDVLKNSGLIDPQTAERYMNEIKQQQQTAQQLEAGKQQTEIQKVREAKQ